MTLQRLIPKVSQNKCCRSRGCVPQIVDLWLIFCRQTYALMPLRRAWIPSIDLLNIVLCLHELLFRLHCCNRPALLQRATSIVISRGQCRDMSFTGIRKMIGYRICHVGGFI